MSARSGLSDRAASVLDADPRLTGALGARDALAVGRAALLPVLTLSPGPWAPPARAAVGDRTVGLAVLAGLLCDAHVVLGPGDLADPWTDGGEWVACTPVRLAVIGAAFADAIGPWPDVSRLAAAPRAPRLARGGTVIDLLWRLAARWGRPTAGGVSLSPAFGVAALARLTGLTMHGARAELAGLEGRGALERRGEGAWVLLSPPHDSPARERLRAAAARQCAVARLTQADTAALFMALDDRRRDRTW